MARKTDLIYLRIAPEHKEHLERLAKEKDVSLSEMARSLMLAMLEGKEKLVTVEELDRFEKKLDALEKRLSREENKRTRVKRAGAVRGVRA